MCVGFAQELSLPNRPLVDIDKDRTVQFLRGRSEKNSINLRQRAWMLHTEDHEDADKEWEEVGE
jgi:hypothetical protein